MRDRISIVGFFSSDDPLTQLDQTPQVAYLRRYLSDLFVKTVLIEPKYFDRDYLSEFAAFYGRSARGYPNVCQRLHFFKETKPSTIADLFERALEGDADAERDLQSMYCGFSVIRPIPSAPLGRTVLDWYPDEPKRPPRIVEPSRIYECHVAGITLRMRGVAWQQQDTAVSACATIALWVILQSSAFDENHSIPTTADITRMAHYHGSEQSRIFPSSGLSDDQICNALSQFDLAPLVIVGDFVSEKGFTREFFATMTATLIRSGYPVLVSGHLEGHGHTICAMGFREAEPPVSLNAPQFADTAIEHLYIHDDNLGPNVRFEITDGVRGPVILKPSAPPPRSETTIANPTLEYGEFRPDLLIAATHEELRITPSGLSGKGLKIALVAQQMIDKNVSISTKFIKLRDYLGRELAAELHGPTLARVRRDLMETVPPMSFHLGLLRIGTGPESKAATYFRRSLRYDRHGPAHACVCIRRVRGFGEKAVRETRGEWILGLEANRACVLTKTVE